MKSMPVQLFMGRDGTRPEPDRMEQIRNRPWSNKPTGGLWTSTFRLETNDSDWIEWCRSEMPDWETETKWALYPTPARILEIDTLEDCEKLYASYGVGWDPDAFNLGTINFEKMLLDYDAVHLTAKGQAETRLTRPSLYGWDCESTLWLRWMFEKVEAIKPRKRLIEVED